MFNSQNEYDIPDFDDDKKKQSFDLDMLLPFANRKERRHLVFESFLDLTWFVLFLFSLLILDTQCESPYRDYAVIVLWMIPIEIFIEILFISLIMYGWQRVILKDWLYITAIIALVVWLVFILYMWVYGIFVLFKYDKIESCAELFYLTIAYVIFLTMQATWRIIAPFIAAPIGHCCTKIWE